MNPMDGWVYQGDGRCAGGWEKCWHRGDFHAHEIGDADDPDDPGIEYVAHRSSVTIVDDDEPCFSTIKLACQWAGDQEEAEALVAELTQRERELEAELKRCREQLQDAEQDLRWRPKGRRAS